MKPSRLVLGCALLGAVVPCGLANADPEPITTPTPTPTPATTPTPTPTPTPTATPTPTPTPTATPTPTPTATPTPTPATTTVAVPSLAAGQHFVLDPVADGALTVAGFGFSFLLGEVLGTGEIKPPPINVPASQLLPIDRLAVTQTIDSSAATFSDIGLATALGFAVLDPIMSGVRDGWDAALVDAFMYAESGSLAMALTDVTKIAVRRPRPIDYQRCPATLQDGAYVQSTNAGCGSTDLGLSFWSGHAAGVGAVGATATYLAFIRDPHSPRPWITLIAALGLETFVSIERVRAGEHFPTDVIAGSLAGAVIGVLVPHLHRHASEAPPVWLGITQVPGGGTLGLQGRF